MYYDIGVVLYSPSVGRYQEDPYEIGDVIPVITHFASSEFSRGEFWIYNTIKGLKVGDTIAFNIMTEEMYLIKTIEGLGVRAIGLDFDVLDKT